MIMFYANYVTGNWVSESFISYIQPQNNPQVFAGLRNASNSVITEITTIQEVARDNAISTPSGTRSSFSTFTIINSAQFMDALLDLGEQYARSLPTLSTINLIFQPFWTRPRVQSFAYGGGNVLGLENERRDLVIVLIHTTWSDPARTREIKTNMERFIDDAQRLAQRMGVYHPYLYLNYAESFQDVMLSYGPESVEFMLKTSEKYDPTQLWQRRSPGGFKLPRKRSSAVPQSPLAQPYQPTSAIGQYPPQAPNGQYPPNSPGGQYPSNDPYGQYYPYRVPIDQSSPSGTPINRPPLSNTPPARPPPYQPSSPALPVNQPFLWGI
jgi:hypothetical protein